MGNLGIFDPHGNQDHLIDVTGVKNTPKLSPRRYNRALWGRFPQLNTFFGPPLMLLSITGDEK